jgi:ubiquinone/menaquinone biosynthesis C-methylase UbiE
VEQVRRAYAVMAERYIELFGSSAQVHPDDLALIARRLSIRPGTVLDVGCGPGHLTAHLRSLDVDATGIDIVPEFIDHARLTDPDGRYEVRSMHRLGVPDRSVAGILAWYSLIPVPPDGLDGVLAELRRVVVPGATLLVGFFEGDEVSAFEHKVTTAYRWPVDELSARLRRASFTEVERHLRPGIAEPGPRPHAAIAAIAG